MVNFKLFSPVSHILQSLLHVIFMEIHLRRHTLWVYEWRIAFNSSKNTVMLFGKTVRSKSSNQSSYLAASIMGQDNTLILEWPCWTWSWPGQHILTQLEGDCHSWACWACFLKGQVACPLEILSCQLMCFVMDCVYPVWRSAACCHVQKSRVQQLKCLYIVTDVSWFLTCKLLGFESTFFCLIMSEH